MRDDSVPASLSRSPALPRCPAWPHWDRSGGERGAPARGTDPPDWLAAKHAHGENSAVRRRRRPPPPRPFHSGDLAPHFAPITVSPSQSGRLDSFNFMKSVNHHQCIWDVWRCRRNMSPPPLPLPLPFYTLLPGIQRCSPDCSVTDSLMTVPERRSERGWPQWAVTGGGLALIGPLFACGANRAASFFFSPL